MGCYIGEVGDGLFGGYSNPWKRVLEADNKAALGKKEDCAGMPTQPLGAVEMTGLEPAASTSRTWRATNCATSRFAVANVINV